MGFLSRVVAEQKGASTFWEQLVKLLDGGAKSKAGPSVNLQAAFRVSAALACMRAISQGCAQVPFKLMRDYEEAGLARKRAARDHVLYDLVTAKPNSWQSAFEFRETQALHACMGNSYAYKGKYRGKVAELILLDPARVKPVQHADWSITYKVTGRDGVTEVLAPDQIWHVRGPSWDGFMGLETLSMAREAMGLSIALEQSQANLHANGVRPTGVYSVDGSLDERQYDKLNAWIKKEAAAGGGGTLILDRGAKWLSQTMTGVDAQHKEIRDQQVEEVCRFFGILPTVIGFTGDKANTYASAEAMFAAHRVQTLAPWWTRIQESADINLLRDDERKQGYYFKHIASGLLLATAKDQGEVFAKALGSGGSPAWMTQDEVRELLELDPFGGEAAKLPPRVAAPARAPAPANP